jgi:invasion protein IalB
MKSLHHFVRLICNALGPYRSPVRQYATADRPVPLLVFAVFLTATPLSRLSADELEKKSTIGDWSIYCANDVLGRASSTQDCSVVTAVEAETDPNAWLRLGFTFSSPDKVAMTIRTPRLNYFRKGISISGDGRQIGRAFIDRCNDTSCQTTVAVDALMLEKLESSKIATFQYQVSDDESVALSVKLDQFEPALSELRTITGFSPISWVVAKNDATDRDQNRHKGLMTGTFKVEIRWDVYSPATLAMWGAPLKDCFGLPASKLVQVSFDHKIQDRRALDEWLSHSRRCTDTSSVWVTNLPHEFASDGPPDEILRYQMLKNVVYEAVLLKIPNSKVVTTDLSGHVPVNPPEDPRRIFIGKEYYFMSDDGYLMPTKKDQPPPDMRYFKPTH